MEILSDAEAMAGIQEARNEVARGEVIEPCRLRVTASAGRTIQYKLPEGIAAAVVEFIT